MLIYYTIAEFTLLADGHRYFIFGMANEWQKECSSSSNIYGQRAGERTGCPSFALICKSFSQRGQSSTVRNLICVEKRVRCFKLMNKMHLITADLIYAGPNILPPHTHRSFAFAFARDTQLEGMAYALRFQFVLNREADNNAGKLHNTSAIRRVERTACGDIFTI